MLKDKKFLILFLLLFVCLSVGFVSANQHDAIIEGHILKNNVNDSFLNLFKNHNEIFDNADIKNNESSNTTIESTDVTKDYGESCHFTVRVLDDQGNPKQNADVSFMIEKMGSMPSFYHSVTNEKGYATLDFQKIPLYHYDLRPGVYNIATCCDGVSVNNKVTILDKTIIESKDVTQYYEDGVNFTVKVVDGKGHPKPNLNVSFTINGETFYCVSNIEGYATLNLNDFEQGVYNVTTSCNEATQNNKISILSKTFIESNNTTKYYGDDNYFTVRMVDGNGNPKPNLNVSFTINGETFYNVSNDEGYATLNLNDFKPNVYEITTSCNEASQTNTINIYNKYKNTIISNDITLNFDEPGNFTVRVLDSSANPDAHRIVGFILDGKTYYETTDEYGYATLPIDVVLNPGENIITTFINGVSTTNKITVLLPKDITIESNDAICYEHEPFDFIVRIMDSKGHPIPVSDVSFEVNGQTTCVTTDGNGYARLPINLEPGNYIITTTINGVSKSNTLHVKHWF